MSQYKSVQVCSGCKRKFAKEVGNQPPAPPQDMIIRQEEYPQWVEQHTGILRTGRLTWVSYHVSENCMKAKNPAFTPKMIDKSPVVTIMSPQHKQYLQTQLSIVV